MGVTPPIAPWNGPLPPPPARPPMYNHVPNSLGQPGIFNLVPNQQDQPMHIPTNVAPTMQTHFFPNNGVAASSA